MLICKFLLKFLNLERVVTNSPISTQQHYRWLASSMQGVFNEYSYNLGVIFAAGEYDFYSENLQTFLIMFATINFALVPCLRLQVTGD